jgi:hypothetical protein
MVKDLISEYRVRMAEFYIRLDTEPDMYVRAVLRGHIIECERIIEKLKLLEG